MLWWGDSVDCKVKGSPCDTIKHLNLSFFFERRRARKQISTWVSDYIALTTLITGHTCDPRLIPVYATDASIRWWFSFHLLLTRQSQQMSHEKLFLDVLFGVISLWFSMENCYLRGRKTSSVNSLARNTNTEYCKDHAGQWVAPVLFHPLSSNAE